MALKTGRQFLHTPGPTAIPERVLNAMHRQPCELNDPELVQLTNSCFDDLKSIFRTTGDMFVYITNGHGGWEAVLSNLFDAGDYALVPETGYFSSSWAEMARALGVHVVDLPADKRHAIDPQAIEKALRADTQGKIKAVLTIHTDTATGITSDIPAIRQAIDAAGHPALLVVDVVASLGATEFRMDEWGVDVAFSASQKALMGPPGLAFVTTNERARKIASRTQRHRYYWDWDNRDGPEGYRRFCGTAPEHNLFALRAALDLVLEEGLENIIRRHARLAGAVHAAVESWQSAGDLELNARRPAERSNSVTTIITPPDFKAGLIRDHGRDHRAIALGGGLGTLSGRAFRIGHLGDLNEPMILGCLGAVELVLCDLGIRHGSGGVRAAIEYLARTPVTQPDHAPKMAVSV
ncbi:MAG: aminotransferase class V-fold PLP-dependent enzyme [Brucellaceae bacterium]|jgi:alanine-glyoxylate transaminase/serine-glyoxylate transaminase/serine-pyruvate transaminase|nr:aminotransferase class V-fold PLP-dependent enzyme [Brucellaceae bacterium]